MDWLLDLLGLPQEFHSSGAGGGVIQDTASSATLCALIAAREKVSGFAVDQDGVTEKMTVYASGQTHSSIEKAVRIAGLGSRQFRQVATDADLRLDPADLDRQITEDRAQGQIPTMVVATVGTTATTAVDSVSEIAEVSQTMSWLHVDSAHAGTAAYRSRDALDSRRGRRRRLFHLQSPQMDVRRFRLQCVLGQGSSGARPGAQRSARVSAQ